MWKYENVEISAQDLSIISIYFIFPYFLISLKK